MGPQTADEPARPGGDGLWDPVRRPLTVGLVLTITLVAFEALAVATVMPEVKEDLGDLSLYGWVFSGFFLTSLLGIVVAGVLADRLGPRPGATVGLVLFAAGLAVGGLAPSMPVLVLGRLAQGFGAGAVPATGYAAIARAYPAPLRPRMFAVLSTAWVVPGLIGPAAATVVEHAASWRWVFLGLLPLVVVAGAIVVPALGTLPLADADADGAADDAASDAADADAAEIDPVPDLDPDGVAVDTAGAESVEFGAPAALADRHRLVQVVLLVVGVALVLVAGTGVPVAGAVPLAVVGVAVAVRALGRLLPVGTFRLAAGVPATVAVRGLLTASFFAADAYLPLMVVDGRGAATWVAGAALSAVALSWAGAAWVQARVIERVGPRRLDRTGFALLLVAVALLAGVAQGLPVGLAVLAWTIGGFAIGLAYAPLSVTVLGSAPPGQEGAASAALQLSDTLGVVVGTGVGGWVVALGDHRGWAVADATTVVFALALCVALGGLAASGRLPDRVPHA
jgi:MFS family permease